MADSPGLIPALVLQRQLESLAHLGLDVDHVRSRVGPIPIHPDAMVPVHQYDRMWSVAQDLYVLERTPQRRLRELGRTYSQVVEDFRREEALRLLQGPRLHLVQVAARLGYSEQTSFTRAFRRWTGETPGVWRAVRVAGRTTGA